MSKAKTITDFMAENDRDTIITAKIKAALTALAKESAYEYEADFAKRCGLQVAELTRYRGSFKQHIAFTPKLLGRKPRFTWFAGTGAVPPKFRWTPEKDNG